MLSHSVVSNSLWPIDDYSPPGSSVHGISQARIPECVAISSSRGFSPSRVEPASLASPALAGRFFTVEPPGEPINHCPHPQSLLPLLASQLRTAAESKTWVPPFPPGSFWAPTISRLDYYPSRVTIFLPTSGHEPHTSCHLKSPAWTHDDLVLCCPAWWPLARRLFMLVIIESWQPPNWSPGCLLCSIIHTEAKENDLGAHRGPVAGSRPA